MKAMITISKVSVMGLWHKNLHFLNRILLKIPDTRPSNIDTKASIIKFPTIEKKVATSNSKLSLNLTTVPNRMILTISLKTPSP